MFKRKRDASSAQWHCPRNGKVSKSSPAMCPSRKRDARESLPAQVRRPPTKPLQIAMRRHRAAFRRHAFPTAACLRPGSSLPNAVRRGRCAARRPQAVPYPERVDLQPSPPPCPGSARAGARIWTPGRHRSRMQAACARPGTRPGHRPRRDRRSQARDLPGCCRPRRHRSSPWRPGKVITIFISRYPITSWYARRHPHRHRNRRLPASDIPVDLSNASIILRGPQI